MVRGTNRQLRHLLIAVDPSRGAERLVRRAALLPLAADATLLIFHVLPAGLPRRAEATARRSTEEKLRRLRGTVETATGVAGVTVRIETGVGQPYVEVIRRSRALGADLVVVGREGKRGLRDRVAMGSTPKRVIRKGDVPVLVVASEPARPYRRPIVAVDLSDSSWTVVDLAWRILDPEGRRHGALVHAYDVPSEGWLREVGLSREYRDTASARLQSLHAALGDESPRWRTVLRKGDPRVVVLREAQRRSADLVVVGTHGRSGVSHALLGSVAEWLVSELTCDVAITRPVRYSFEPP